MKSLPSFFWPGADNARSRTAGRKHLLTIAVEDYFQAPAFVKLINNKHWSRFEPRFETNCLHLLSGLEQVQSAATFFVPAWIAQRRPDLLRELTRRGHEVALAGARELDLDNVSAELFRLQIKRDRETLEDACGQRVLGFRATGPFLRRRHLWSLDALAEEGFVYDSSLCPYLRTFAREPWRRYIHQAGSSANSLWEVPLTSQVIAGLTIPFAGGNFFRQFPECVVRASLRHQQRQNENPLVLYFRLWDVDPNHPRLRTASLWQHYRHYRNGARIVHTFDRLLHEYQFTSIADYLRLIPEACAAKERVPETVHEAGVPPRLEQLLPISIIVPCFNEESGVPYLANTLRDLKAHLSDRYDAQFIIVDDGSTDKTWQALTQYFSLRTDTLLLRHARNRGIASAITSGLRHAREIACSMDCDCSYDPHELKPMLGLLRDDVDLVTASPYDPAGSVVNVPHWRLALSKSASQIYQVVTGRKISTFTACFRVYRRSAALKIPLRKNGFLGVAELLSCLLLRGSTVVEHPATLNVRIFGQSKMKVARTVLGHLGLLTYLMALRLRQTATEPPTVNVDALPAESIDTNICQVLNYDKQQTVACFSKDRIAF